MIPPQSRAWHTSGTAGGPRHVRHVVGFLVAVDSTGNRVSRDRVFRAGRGSRALGKAADRNVRDPRAGPGIAPERLCPPGEYDSQSVELSAPRHVSRRQGFALQGAVRLLAFARLTDDPCS